MDNEFENWETDKLLDEMDKVDKQLDGFLQGLTKEEKKRYMALNYRVSEIDRELTRREG